MAESLVTGIAPSGDAAQVVQMLAGAQLDEARLAIVTKASARTNMLGGNQQKGGTSLSTASTIMTGSSGTSVPGIGSARASMPLSHSEVPDYLGGLPLIPRDQAEHFNVAIAEGRALVTYKATPEEAPQVQEAFRNAGLRNVKVFKPKEAVS